MRAELNMFGPMTQQTGYGIHFTNLCRALGHKLKVSITPRSNVEPALNADPLMAGMLNTPFNYTAPSINIWFPNNMQQFTGQVRIGFPVFELDKLEDEASYHLDWLDGVLVTSGWARNIIRESTGSDDFVGVVGEGYDEAVFAPRKVNEAAITLNWKRPYIQNIGKWEKRKGHEMLIGVLSTIAELGLTFTFVGMWENPFRPDWRNVANHHLVMHGWYKTGDGTYERDNARIVLPQRVEMPYDLANLINLCDFGVYPYFAEGWGLPILETMACGKPVVATLYSGPTEYLRGDCGILLQNWEMVRAYDDHFFASAEGNWAENSPDELRSAIIEMIEKTDEERFSMGMKAMERAQEFTWEKSAERVIAFLEEFSWI